MTNNEEKYIVWNPKFEIGIPYIDSQHKKLVELCADLYDSILSKQQESEMNQPWQESLSSALKECVQYVKFHFGVEEKMMTLANYDKIEAHKQKHIAFTRKVLETARAYQTWKFKDALDFVKFLYDWVLTHIAFEDKLYISAIKEYLKNKDNKNGQ